MLIKPALNWAFLSTTRHLKQLAIFSMAPSLYAGTVMWLNMHVNNCALISMTDLHSCRLTCTHPKKLFWIRLSSQYVYRYTEHCTFTMYTYAESGIVCFSSPLLCGNLNKNADAQVWRDAHIQIWNCFTLCVPQWSQSYLKIVTK